MFLGGHAAYPRFSQVQLHSPLSYPQNRIDGAPSVFAGTGDICS